MKYANNFSMTNNNDEAVFVECSSQLARLDISETMITSIKGLYFTGCTNNRVSKVKQLTIEDTIFQGVKGSDTALILNATTAVIVNCTFLLNEHSRLAPSDSAKQNGSMIIGGALFAAISNIRIDKTNFGGNKSPLCVAISVLSCNVSITNSQL